jgi:pyruvate formate lyase activating enzyme
VDYVALDYKAPKKKWNVFMGVERVFNLFLETLDILQNSDIPFEVRTTVHTDVTDESDILSILRHLESIGYKGTYFIQFFFPTAETLGNVSKEMRHSDTEQIKSETIKVEYRNKEGNPPA